MNEYTEFIISLGNALLSMPGTWPSRATCYNSILRNESLEYTELSMQKNRMYNL
jgi:hypothetical protein